MDNILFLALRLDFDSQEIYNYTLSVKNINGYESQTNGSIVVNKVPNLEMGTNLA